MTIPSTRQAITAVSAVLTMLVLLSGWMPIDHDARANGETSVHAEIDVSIQRIVVSFTGNPTPYISHCYFYLYLDGEGMNPESPELFPLFGNGTASFIAFVNTTYRCPVSHLDVPIMLNVFGMALNNPPYTGVFSLDTSGAGI